MGSLLFLCICFFLGCLSLLLLRFSFSCVLLFGTHISLHQRFLPVFFPLPRFLPSLHPLRHRLLRSFSVLVLSSALSSSGCLPRLSLPSVRLPGVLYVVSCCPCLLASLFPLGAVSVCLLASRSLSLSLFPPFSLLLFCSCAASSSSFSL